MCHDFDFAWISACPLILLNYFLFTLLYSQVGRLWKPPGREAGKKNKCTLLNVKRDGGDVEVPVEVESRGKIAFVSRTLRSLDYLFKKNLKANRS